MIFSKFTTLQNSSYHPIVEYNHHSPKSLCAGLQPVTLPPATLGNHWSTFHLHRFAFSGHSHKWDHVTWWSLALGFFLYRMFLRLISIVVCIVLHAFLLPNSTPIYVISEA